MKKTFEAALAFLLLALAFATPALAEGGALVIDTENAYEGMAKSYAKGYVPSVSGGNAHFVLPLKSSDAGVTTITVTPAIDTSEASPFSYGNYEFDVPLKDGVFLIRLSLPLKANRMNGTYAVTFRARYTDSAGKAQAQEFPVYLTITDGKDPNATEEKPVSGELYIDSGTLYTGMNKTYAAGYMPSVTDGKATLILPLLGDTYDGRVTVTLNLGSTANSPFLYGNYSQTRGNGWGGAYLFAFELPLVKGRYNGSYPVTLNAEYLNAAGAAAKQSFTVYITITDGKSPPDPNAIAKVEAEKPELFISACTIDPAIVGGDSEFTVTLTIDNIGNIRARSVKLTYGSEAAGILPADANNAILLENIAAGESATATFKLKTTKDVLAGNQSFYAALDYNDLYGGAYVSTRQFLIPVTQPVEAGYDSISVAKSVTAGETFTLPANVFNIGKATLRNVTVTVTGAGLFPTSSVFLGDILPGEAGYGELKIFVGMLSMTEGYSQSYGQTVGRYIISYYDDADEEYTVSLEFTTEIKAPVIETDTAPKEDPAPVVQWWVAVLVGFAAIAILVTAFVLARFTRMMKMK